MRLQLNPSVAHLEFEYLKDSTCRLHTQFVLLLQVSLLSWTKEPIRSTIAQDLDMQTAKQSKSYDKVL